MNKRASVLMIGLWVLAILVTFAVGIGYRSSLDLRLSRYYRDNLKVGFLARSGIERALALLKEDSSDPQTKEYDTIGECGVSLKGRNEKDLFERRLENNAGVFRTGYYDAQKNFKYGMRDEESKININFYDPIHRQMLVVLLKGKNIADDKEVIDLAGFIMEWINPNNKSSIAKKGPLKAPEELSAVIEYFYALKGRNNYKQKAREIFGKAENLITIYGKGSINLNTADSEVLKILIKAVVQEMADDGEPDILTGEDISRLLDKIEAYRKGVKGDHLSYFKSSDINPQSIKEALGLRAEINNQTRIIDAMADFLCATSENFRIEAIGSLAGVDKKIGTVYDRSKQRVVYWRQN
jgi:type II secretory pathway component PulK